MSGSSPANATPWWQKYREVVPDWFQVYVGLEEAAALIRIYEVQFVPGLLQTEDYARILIREDNPGVVAAEPGILQGPVFAPYAPRLDLRGALV